MKKSETHMNKIKRISLLFREKTLRFWKFVSAKRYRRAVYKYFRDCGVVFEGMPKHINYDVEFDLTHPGLIHIGEGTVIAGKAVLLTHDYSVECGLTAIGETDPDYEMLFLKEIHVGKNCFIGARAFILPGTTIGDNCIIGANSVVSGDIPANSIYAGNPARFVTHTDEWARRKLEQHTFVQGNRRQK